MFSAVAFAGNQGSPEPRGTQGGGSRGVWCLDGWLGRWWGRNYRVAEASRYLHPAALPMQPRRRVLLGFVRFGKGSGRLWMLKIRLQKIRPYQSGDEGIASQSLKIRPLFFLFLG